MPMFCVRMFVAIGRIEAVEMRRETWKHGLNRLLACGWWPANLRLRTCTGHRRCKPWPLLLQLRSTFIHFLVDAPAYLWSAICSL
jgi:hypothetical protein